MMADVGNVVWATENNLLSSSVSFMVNLNKGVPVNLMVGALTEHLILDFPDSGLEGGVRVGRIDSPALDALATNFN